MDKHRRIRTRLHPDEPSPLGTLLTLDEAGRSLPRPRSGKSVYRWVAEGVRIRGEFIRLDAIVLGRSHYITPAARLDWGQRVANAKKGGAA